MDVPDMVIHPSPFNQPNVWAAYLFGVATWIAALVTVTHPSLFGVWLADARVRVAVYAWIAVVPMGIASGLISRRTDSIYLTPAHIGHTSLIGGQGAHPRSALARIVLFLERRYRGLYTPKGVLRPVIAFESCAGGELFRVYTRQWRLPDLQRLATACGVPIEGEWGGHPRSVKPARLGVDLGMRPRSISAAAPTLTLMPDGTQAASSALEGTQHEWT